MCVPSGENTRQNCKIPFVGCFLFVFSFRPNAHYSLHSFETRRLHINVIHPMLSSIFNFQSIVIFDAVLGYFPLFCHLKRKCRNVWGALLGIQSDWKRKNNNFLSFSLFVTLERNKCHNITNAPNNVCAYVRTKYVNRTEWVRQIKVQMQTGVLSIFCNFI